MTEHLTEIPDATSLTIRRVFAADIATLWQALTDPEAWMHWFGGGHARPISTNADLRPGGAWRIEMRGEDSADRHIVSGEFLEVHAPTRVTFTWAWYTTPERISRVSYRLLPGETEGRTVLVLTHDRFFDAAARDGHNRGWGHALDRLADWIAPREDAA